MTGQIEKENSITKIYAVGNKVNVVTERKEAEEKYQMWLNEERF